MTPFNLSRPLGRACAALLLVAAAGAAVRPARAQAPLTLQQAIALAQRQAFGTQIATSSRDAARARDRAFGATLLPQISLQGTLPDYNRSIIPVIQPDGSTLYRPQQLNQNSLALDVSQRLPILGGDLFVRSGLSRLQLAGENQQRTWSSSPFVVGVRQSIFRPNSLRWDSREQNLLIDVAERQFLEDREQVAIQTANAFFDLYTAKMLMETAATNAAVNDTLYTLNKGRYEVGKIGENDLLQSELALLRSRTSLDGAKLEYDRTQAALRLQLNVDAGTPIDVDVTTRVIDVVPDTARAVAEALRNGVQTTELRLAEVQARRRVNDARLSNSFYATVEASVGYNQTAGDVSQAYRNLLDAQRLSLAVSIPLVQWGGHHAQVEAARADQDRQSTTSRQARAQLAQDAHYAALLLEQSRRQLALSAKADTVADKRFDVAKNRYVIGKIGIDNLYIAQSEKDQARQAFVQALRVYWVAFYRLRRITLYDFVEGREIR